MKKALLALLVLGITVGGVGLMISKEEDKPSKGSLVMYKSPNCGCCTGHLAYLRKEDYEVEVVQTEEMDTIKKQQGVPIEMESCHTVIGNEYFIEGHVPIEAIDKLLTEKPEIDGIGLPDMPSGSPGMPGYKKEPFEILSLVNNEVKEWMKI